MVKRNLLPLRQALCTEAALNAIQRRYPQVYKTNDRLLLDPTSIHVQARDFMASVKSESSNSSFERIFTERICRDRPLKRKIGF